VGDATYFTRNIEEFSLKVALFFQGGGELF
jgi:hypothetical protein